VVGEKKSASLIPGEKQAISQIGKRIRPEKKKERVGKHTSANGGKNPRTDIGCNLRGAREGKWEGFQGGGGEKVDQARLRKSCTPKVWGGKPKKRKRCEGEGKENKIRAHYGQSAHGSKRQGVKGVLINKNFGGAMKRGNRIFGKKKGTKRLPPRRRGFLGLSTWVKYESGGVR